MKKRPPLSGASYPIAAYGPLGAPGGRPRVLGQEAPAGVPLIEFMHMIYQVDVDLPTLSGEHQSVDVAMIYRLQHLVESFPRLLRNSFRFLQRRKQMRSRDLASDSTTPL